MYPLVLKQIESNHDNLRTEDVAGLAPKLPKVGERFFMYSDPLDTDKDGRYISTSTVKKVRVTEDKAVIFWTNNSVYEIVFEEID